MTSGVCEKAASSRGSTGTHVWLLGAPEGLLGVSFSFPLLTPELWNDKLRHIFILIKSLFEQKSIRIKQQPIY